MPGHEMSSFQNPFDAVVSWLRPGRAGHEAGVQKRSQRRTAQAHPQAAQKVPAAVKRRIVVAFVHGFLDAGFWFLDGVFRNRFFWSWSKNNFHTLLAPTVLCGSVEL